MRSFILQVDNPTKEASEDEIDEFCGTIKRFLRTLDIMFSIFRKKQGELLYRCQALRYEEAAHEAARLWHILGFYYTPRLLVDKKWPEES